MPDCLNLKFVVDRNEVMIDNPIGEGTFLPPPSREW